MQTRYVEEDTKKEEKKIEENIEPKSHFKLYFIIFLIIASLFLYIKYISTSLIEVHEYKISSTKIPESFHGIKIVHFSDIHYGTNINLTKLKNIVNKINDLNPDIVIFTGDLFDKDINVSDDEVTSIIEELNKINVTLYKYCVNGNEDNEKYHEIMTNANFKVLNNESIDLYNNGNTPISIIGFPSSIINTQDYNVIPINDNYKIALTHESDVINNLTNKVDLVLSGHTLGGIINIGKPLFTSEGCKDYYESYYNIDNTDIYISNGLGTNKYNIRFNNRPSINLYRLYHEQ